MDWQLKSLQIPQTIDQIIEVLLAARGISDQSAFFSPQHPTEYSVSDVGLDSQQVDIAVERIMHARAEEQKVVVYGDYDADGICATAVLWQTLHALGISAQPFIPHREKHGYGISDAAIEEIFQTDQPSLIITVDNGIVAHQPLQQLADRGVDVIVTDHHQPEAELPPAEAHVHTSQLCGTTVAWMLARELAKSENTTLEKLTGNNQLDLCAIATIADLVPLQEANRSFAYYGLQTLSENKRPGLQALFTQASIDLSQVSAGTVGYGIGPRINAMGRMKHGLDALRLLCTSNTKRATSLAQTLEETNKQRQEATSEAVEAALLQAKQQQDQHLIVIHSDEFAEGVIGLVAGKLVEKYHKPALVFATGKDVAKASARSVPGVNITELLRMVQDDLEAVGGHPMAAGCSVRMEQFTEVVDKLQQIAKKNITSDQLGVSLTADVELPLELATLELAEQLEQFAPFGKNNPRPTFLLRNVTAHSFKTIGKDQTHLKFVVTQGEHSIPVLYWRGADQVDTTQNSLTLSLSVKLEINEWRDRRNVQGVVTSLV